MTRTSKFTAWGLLATLAATVATPVLADQQSDKNNMRNLAIAGAAVAGYGLLNHNNTATLLGAAGAALAGSQYEKNRKQQSQDSNDGYYNRRYHRTYDNSSQYSNGNGRSNNGSQWRNDYNSNNDNNRSYNNRSYNNDGQNAGARHDNGRHLGWTKHNGRNQDGDDQH